MKIEDRERLTHERGQQIADMSGYEYYTRLPEGRDACIARIGFNWMIIADLTEWGYGDRWCFATKHLALRGLGMWIDADGKGEPQGWHRHPETGRRRPDGDASKEYINP
jgi:hypothetical protein